MKEKEPVRTSAVDGRKIDPILKEYMKSKRPAHKSKEVYPNKRFDPKTGGII